MISGANRGIGAAIARALAEQGWRLSLGVREPKKLGSAHFAHRYEALDAKSERLWVDATTERFGRIDAVIANAGILSTKSVVEAGDDDVDAILEVNVKSPLRLVRAAWPHLAKSGKGRVVVISSLSGKRVKAAQTGLYAVSKFAALGLAHAVRHAGWEVGIRTTAICPGPVATDMIRAISTLSPSEMTRPEDLAKLVLLVLDLPNTASLSEIPVNALIEGGY
ncbi:MAG: SDR family NAD(P)-dependent oxidoreductase [Proteobacteria bacterium]|nr:SDR family NAD(P)-dependent oxidoreductase [Pseudomonadota bacterium]MBI3499983.1 SDR family NAD(P)-dependent oxidoreductase [Pseudomonadota bacterium]